MFAVAVALTLIALACTCGPLQRVQEAQGTIGAVQATVAPALTSYKENEPTIQAAMTELARNAPTYEAYMTQFAGTATVGGPEFYATMNAVVPGFDSTMTAVLSGGGVPSGSGSGGVGEDNLIHQWASSAVASSQYSDTDGSAMQAAGAPDVTQCVDDARAWASVAPDEKATLTLYFDRPVIPVRISIIHSYYPSSVTEIAVADSAGQPKTLFVRPPLLVNICPFTEVFTVSVPTGKINMVIITVDQSQIRSWDEIDAVELAGIP